LKDFIKEVGDPNFVIYLNVQKDVALTAYTRKNEIEVDPEKGLSEEETEKFEKNWTYSNEIY